MKNLLDNISLKMKLIFLIIFPFLGFLLISALYLNQILVNDFSSNLTFVVPTLFPKTKKLSSFFNQIDYLLNFFINIKLNIQKTFISRKLENISIEYLNIIDDETLNIINKFNKNDISHKGKDFFEWLKAYN